MKKHKKQQELEHQINIKLNEFYKRAIDILTDSNSYTKAVDLAATHLYIAFLSNALKKPANRLASLSTFLEDIDGMMVHSMYPFRYLRPVAVRDIERLNGLVLCLIEAYETLYFPDDGDCFYVESIG